LYGTVLVFKVNMDDTVDLTASDASDESAPIVPVKATPIESRFLFVDVAAMRAKQLRRGARVRLNHDDVDQHRAIPHKAERVAMEEVRRCLVLYEVPSTDKPLPRD
jgi:DNA-directed RNA polymerase subunit K/omega